MCGSSGRCGPLLLGGSLPRVKKGSDRGRTASRLVVWLPGSAGKGEVTLDGEKTMKLWFSDSRPQSSLEIVSGEAWKCTCCGSVLIRGVGEPVLRRNPWAPGSSAVAGLSVTSRRLPGM